VLAETLCGRWSVANPLLVLGSSSIYRMRLSLTDSRNQPSTFVSGELNKTAIGSEARRQLGGDNLNVNDVSSCQCPWTLGRVVR